MKRSGAGLVVLMFIIAGCAVRLGGPSPVQRDTLVWRLPDNITAEDLGARLQTGSYELAMLATSRDSAFLAAAATRAGLKMTRPGRIGQTNYVFFGPKVIGDTTHSIQVASGGHVRLHDALFEIDKTHRVDLIVARFDSVTDLRAGVNALIQYVAKDVSSSVPLLLAFEQPSQQVGDSVAVIVRALLADTRDCNSGTAASIAQSPLRLLYGPEARVRCERAQVLNESGGPVSALFTLP